MSTEYQAQIIITESGGFVAAAPDVPLAWKAAYGIMFDLENENSLPKYVPADDFRQFIGEKILQGWRCIEGSTKDFE